jgi:DNA-binding transcriptional regulator LsrR (DeoR family)
MQTSTQRREIKGRPEDKPDNAQMRQVARMYYLEGLTRQKISEQLGLDPRKTSWLLDMAYKLGVVRIDIRGETDQEELAARLQKKFDLKRVFIAPPGPEIKTAQDAPLYTPLLRNLAVLAADYFDGIVSRQEQDNPGQPFRIGISGGTSLYQFVKAVPEKLRPNVHVHATSVVAHGQLETSGSHVDPSTNCTNLWTKAGGLPGQCHYTTMTPFDTDARGLPEGRKFIKKELKRLTGNRKIEAVLTAAQEIDVAFTGLGTLTPPPGADAILMNQLTMMSLLQPIITLKDLATEKAVGELSYCLFDENGDSNDHWRFFPMVGDFSEYKGVDFYRHMCEQRKTVVAIAGPYKLDPIKAALKGKLINVLITDEHTAREVIEGS